MKKLLYVLVIIVCIYLGWEFFRPRGGKIMTQTRSAGVIALDGGTASSIDSVLGRGDAPDEQASVTVGPASVTYLTEGFSPANVTVKKGSVVIWSNISLGGMQVAVNEHPTHAGYDGTGRREHCAKGAKASFDQCTTGLAGSQWSFIFNTTGIFNYHNHINEIFGGTVTVTE